MRNGNPYLGGGRYIQTQGAAALLGQELKRYGAKHAFILGGHTALSIAVPYFSPGIREEKLDTRIEQFQGTVPKTGCHTPRKSRSIQPI